jgi:fucose permease
MDLLTAMMVAALLVSGQGVAILGSIKVPLASRLRIDEARVGGLVSQFGFALIPVNLFVGFLTDQIGTQAVLMGGSVLLAASLAGLGWAGNYLATLGLVVLFSTGWSLMINAGNVLTPPAFGGDTAYATNLANVFFGLGAFLTPMSVAWLLRRMSFPAALAVLAGFALIPAVLALGVNFNRLVSTPAVGTVDTGIGPLLSDPMLWLCGMALFFYGPMEASLAAWATTYLTDQGVKEPTAASLLSTFWLLYMAARLTTAFALPAGREAAFILALSLICIAVLTLIVQSRGRGMAMILVPLTGLVFGPIFPTLMAVLLNHFEPHVHGRAVGLFFAIGGLGWTTIPILIGTYARRTTLQRAFVIAVGAAIGLSGVALALVLR